MTLVNTLPWLAGLGLIAFALAYAFGVGSGWRNAWQFPAGLSAVFFAFSLVAVIREGPLGFWEVHSSSLWGNQVWIDLLLAIGIAWALIVPQAKTLGMRVLPWLAVILCTGCIGLLAMVARLFYLKDQAAETRETISETRPAR